VDLENFLKDLYAVRDDEFILQSHQKERGAHPHCFNKNPRPSVLVMKEVRYHYIIETLLKYVPGIKIVGIVRHPCGVMNSWLKTPREFLPHWDASEEWRHAPSKNQNRAEEYYGFEKWRELASLFLRLHKEAPDSFYLLRYEVLVENPLAEVDRLFAFCDLDFPLQAKRFIATSQQREVEDPDTVFRKKDVATRWQHELSPSIRDQILDEVADGKLAEFLD
jgi:hypothetical protein